MHITRTIILSLFLLHSLLLAEVEVSARFNPPRIAMGNTSQYIVEIKETSTSGQPEIERITSLPIPEVQGLNLRNGRTSNSQQTRIINGAAEYSVTQNLIVDVSSSAVGNYTIPDYTLEYKGQRLSVGAATLQVVERSADAGPSRDELVFLKADLPDKLYVGQRVSLELKLYLSEEVQLRGLNSFDRTANGFTISQLPDEYQEGVEMFNGRRYRTLTWPLTLTPIQTGVQDLSFQFGLTARLPNAQNQRDNIRRSPFGGSIFDDFFSRAERLNVYTGPATIEVLPLPKEGQPESFSGAIGNFALEVGADTEEAVQGEPIMLSVILKGSGNFERIDGPAFPKSPDWKHYDPERKFEASDELGMRGSQRFDYIFIPQRTGKLELPETRFSYFDPAKEEYLELTAPPVPVQIKAAQSNFVPPPSVPKTDIPDKTVELSKSLTAEEALLTLDYRPKPALPASYAIVQSPLFISLNTLAGLAFIGTATLIYRNRRNREDPTYPLRSAAKTSLNEARQSYQRALRENDAEAFYKYGQSAIRHAATARTRRVMQSADSEELIKLLTGSTAEDCRAFFTAANAHRFGGHNQQQLSESAEQLERILKAL